MNQKAFPFHETAEDATNTAIIRSGKPFKEVALALWPEKKADSAYAMLKNALRAEHRDKLTADQHLFIANHCGEYDFVYYCCQNTSHGQPEPVEPEDELKALIRQYLAEKKSADAPQDKIDSKLRAVG